MGLQNGMIAVLTSCICLSSPLLCAHVDISVRVLVDIHVRVLVDVAVRVC